MQSPQLQDKHTGRSRGFGFVWFPNDEDRQAAIAEMHKSTLRDRAISVTAAVPQNQTAPGTPAAALGGYRRPGPPRGGGYGDRSRYDRGGYGGGYGADRGCAPLATSFFLALQGKGLPSHFRAFCIHLLPLRSFLAKATHFCEGLTSCTSLHCPEVTTAMTAGAAMKVTKAIVGAFWSPTFTPFRREEASFSFFLCHGAMSTF